MHYKLLIIFLITSLQLGTVTGQDWHVTFDKAKEIAAVEEKPIIMVFQGSDWCAPCIKLDRQIWSTEVFKSYAADNYVMLQVDFPRRKKNALSKEQSAANAILADTYNSQGIFPFVVLLDSHGNQLGHTSYKKLTPEDYIEELNGFLQ